VSYIYVGRLTALIVPANGTAIEKVIAEQTGRFARMQKLVYRTLRSTVNGSRRDLDRSSILFGTFVLARQVDS